jgi:ATP-dependent RNA helicase DDX1
MEDRDALLAVAPDGLRCQSRAERSWSGGRATVGVLKGRYYFEATCCDEGLCRVGWSSKAAALELGTDKQSFGYGGTAKKSHARQFDSYGETYGQVGERLGHWGLGWVAALSPTRHALYFSLLLHGCGGCI